MLEQKVTVAEPAPSKPTTGLVTSSPFLGYRRSFSVYREGGGVPNMKSPDSVLLTLYNAHRFWPWYSRGRSR